MEPLAQQKKTLEIQRGLFLIRYESADDQVNPPRVTISPDPRDGIEFILPPGTDEPVLWSPGASLVVRASRNGRIEVAVAPAHPTGSIGARVQLVPLSNDPAGMAENAALAADIDLSRMRVLGHVAGIGDVIVRPGEWIAGPMAPSRIEGLALEWPDKPRTIDLRYAVRVGGQRPTTTQMVEAGAFAGTRGRALPLVGATLEMSGSGAGGHQLRVDAMFLGSPQMRVAGQRVVLAGPTGREPLVGLRVGIEPIEQPKRARQTQIEPQGPPRKPKRISRQPPARAPIESAKSKPAPASAPTSDRRTGRVRVFRSDGRRGSKAVLSTT